MQFLDIQGSPGRIQRMANPDFLSITTPSHKKGSLPPMAQKLDDNDLVSFKELLMANSIQVDALAQLLIEKGLISEQEFYAKLKQVQEEYTIKGKGKAA
jgi:hypothetical protein